MEEIIKIILNLNYLLNSKKERKIDEDLFKELKKGRTNSFKRKLFKNFSLNIQR
jgi:hypothetical protein